MMGKGKKPALYCPQGPMAGALSALSKQALLDIAWNLALLGTDESPEQVFTHVCREAVIVLRGRHDSIPPAILRAAERRIQDEEEDYIP